MKVNLNVGPMSKFFWQWQWIFEYFNMLNKSLFFLSLSPSIIYATNTFLWIDSMSYKTRYFRKILLNLVLGNGGQNCPKTDFLMFLPPSSPHPSLPSCASGYGKSNHCSLFPLKITFFFKNCRKSRPWHTLSIMQMKKTLV